MEMVEIFAIIVHYNGWEDCVKKICDYVEQYEGVYVPHPDFLSAYDIDLFPNIIWQSLVLNFGDYGTSPRFGWIKEKKKAREFLEKIKSLE